MPKSILNRIHKKGFSKIAISKHTGIPVKNLRLPKYQNRLEAFYEWVLEYKKNL